ncbi:hypothetical protein TrRE_jg10969, partial [Triparma retinervis]
YHAQLIRLQALVSNKQKNKRKTEEAEEKRAKVLESRNRSKKVKEKLAAKGGVKLTDLDYAKLLHWKAVRQFDRFCQEKRKEEEEIIMTGNVAHQRHEEKTQLMKKAAYKEGKEMNAAMAAMAERMIIDKGLREEEEKEKEEKEEHLAANRERRKKLKKRKEKAGGLEKVFNGQVNILNREGAKLRKALIGGREGREARAKVEERKREAKKRRDAKREELKSRKDKAGEDARRQRDGVNELLMKREVFENGKMRARSR